MEADMRHEVYCRACKQWIDTRDVKVENIEEGLYNKEDHDHITFSCLKCKFKTSQRSLVRIGY